MPLVVLNTVSSKQTTATEDTNKYINRYLCYALKFPNSTTTYTASDMVLGVNIDSAYLVEDGSKRRTGGH